MSATFDAEVDAATPPPLRKRRRYRRDIRAISDLDGRTAAARRARELSARLCAGLPSEPTAAQAELIARGTLLSILASDCEVKVLRNQPIDIHAYVALVNCQRRVLQVLGIAPDPKTIDGHANPTNSDEALLAELRDIVASEADEPVAQGEAAP